MPMRTIEGAVDPRKQRESMVRSSKNRPPMNHANADSGIPLVACLSTLSRSRGAVYLFPKLLGKRTCKTLDHCNEQMGGIHETSSPPILSSRRGSRSLVPWYLPVHRLILENTSLRKPRNGEW